MFIMFLFLLIIVCLVFCYIFYKILEIEKDIETLYENYSKELERNYEIRLKEKEKKKNASSFFYNV